MQNIRNVPLKFMFNKYKEVVWLSSYPTHYWRKLFCSIEKEKVKKICFVFFSNYNKNIKYEVGKIPNNSILLVCLYKIFIFFYFIISKPPKLLIIQGYEILPKFLILLLCCFKNIPFCFWGDTNYLIIKKQNFLFKIIKKLILKKIFLRAKKILYIGERNKNYYSWLFNYNLNKNKFFFLPYPTYVNSKFFLKKKNNNKKNFNIIYVGRLAKEKSLVNFFKSLLELKSDILKKLDVKIFGNGKEELKLKNFIKINNLNKTVKFFDSVKSSEVHKCFAKADLFILPSDKEPWGLVVNESIYYGVPILCMHSVGAAKDLIVNKKNGYLMKSNNPVEISNFIKNIYLERDKKKNTKFFGKAYLNKKSFSFETAKNQTIKLIDQCYKI